MSFENCGLWQRALTADVQTYTTQLETLRATYRRFWTNGCHLAGRIAADLPGLTLHDESHFSALWERADQIAGDGLVLTPLEAFVFGGAILLHDAANTVSAFPGGLDEVQASPEWRDAVATLGGDSDAEGRELSDELRNNALLTALRSLHAKRAEELGNFSVTDPTSGQVSYLIQDDVLRTHLGPVIGQIAASHHWDIEELEDKLQSVVGAPMGYPHQWRVRPVLLACLLRCADAIQLDQTRAPDFLKSLLKIRGASEVHWRAQNRLLAPVVDPVDPRALIFSSGRPYGVDDADAWWLAYDAIHLANGELQRSGLLLNDLRMPAFAIDRIRHAESPLRLAQSVRTAGWRPVRAEVRASRIDKLLDMFGGSQLYGTDMAVPLRELIQNAIDAVRRRRETEPNDSTYRGKVTVSIRNRGGKLWLDVEDDGLGMSEGTMTGPLLDFGDSYVASHLARQERPGLTAGTRGRIGRYGIGFFSVFMLGGEVRVVSRPFDAGLSECRTLRFKAGLAMRPLLLDGFPDDFSSNVATKVSTSISEEVLAKMLAPAWDQNQQPLPVTLQSLVSALVPMADVDIFVHTDTFPLAVAHSSEWSAEDKRAQWLQSITCSEARQDEGYAEAVVEAASRLRPVDPTDVSLGLAAISFGRPMGAHTVGGLRSGRHLGNYSEQFAGTLEFEPDGPARLAGRRCADLSGWATEQAELIAESDIPKEVKLRAGLRVASFGGKPDLLAGAKVRGKVALIEEIFDVLCAEGAAAAVLQGERFFVKQDSHEIRTVMTTLRLDQTHPFMTYFRPGELDFSVALLEPTDATDYREFWSFPEEDIDTSDTFVGCLIRYAAARGRPISIEGVDMKIATYVGPASERDKLVSGADVTRYVALFRV